MKIYQLLGAETRWTQGGKAFNKNGEVVAPDSKDAVRWCLIGATEKCYPEDDDRQKVFCKLNRALGDEHVQFKSRLVGNGLIWGWNDAEKRKFKEVKALVRKLGI